MGFNFEHVKAKKVREISRDMGITRALRRCNAMIYNIVFFLMKKNGKQVFIQPDSKQTPAYEQ